MKLFFISLVLGVVFSVTGVALAQSPIQFVSSAVKAGQAVPQACLAEANAFQAKMAQYPQRKGWANVVACDDLVWQRAIDTPGHKVLAVGNYLVDLTSRQLILNGDDFSAAKVKTLDAKTVAPITQKRPATAGHQPSPTPAM